MKCPISGKIFSCVREIGHSGKHRRWDGREIEPIGFPQKVKEGEGLFSELYRFRVIGRGKSKNFKLVCKKCGSSVTYKSAPGERQKAEHRLAEKCSHLENKYSGYFGEGSKYYREGDSSG